MPKVLFDPVYTNDPQFCSMCFKMQAAAKYTVEVRDDTYVTFLLPEPEDGNKWDVNWDWLYKHPRVRYETVPTYNDRMREYYRITPQMERKLQFWGEHWDTDVLVTARIPLVPIYKSMMTSVRANRPYSKRVMTVEDMPIMNYKKCVAQVQPDVQDISHVVGYLAADRACFFSYWERDATLAVAREWLSPSRVRSFASRAVNVSPVIVEGVKVKPDALVRSVGIEKAFTVGYTQRYENQHRRSGDIMEMFERQWVYRGGKAKMRFVSTSNSKGGKTGGVDTDFIEFLRPPREEFWRMMREEVDVVVVMSIDDAYPLSLIEPILNGTPAIVLDAPYVASTLTKDYPFLIKNETEAYGMVKAFFDDYEGMYAKFAEWSVTKYQPQMLERNRDWFPYHLVAEIDDMDNYLYRKLQGSQQSNSVVDLIVSKGWDELNLFDALHQLKADGEVRHLAGEIGAEHKGTNAFTPSWNEFRLRLKFHHGYQDAGHRPGDLARIK